MIYPLYTILYTVPILARAGFSLGTWEPGSQEFFSLTGNFGGNPTLFKRNEILVRVHAHLKGIMSSEIMVIKVNIIFYSSQSLFDIFAEL